ncbi:hypothetical protein FH972_026233 [Carpinus fangiana]|uniref:Uncharacterized protein n=1 Tax=Carpinus fangiana TaxID=176857 RepID=A0A5N6L3C8_9ROSI|nr:hypothetical protein FH972_026233 [Carpinus fangiana]
MKRGASAGGGGVGAAGWGREDAEEWRALERREGCAEEGVEVEERVVVEGVEASLTGVVPLSGERLEAEYGVGLGGHGVNVGYVEEAGSRWRGGADYGRVEMLTEVDLERKEKRPAQQAEVTGMRIRQLE